MKSGMRSTLRLVLTLATCLTLMLSGSFAQDIVAQDAQPTPDPAQPYDPTRPQDSTPAAETPEATKSAETPEPATRNTAAKRADAATTPGAPATLAHGLAYYDGDDLVWQVQELKVPLIADADAETTEPGIVLQREGQSIVRNNATGKRALLNPGDAFFITADDSYTIMAEDDGSVIWKFSLVDPDDVAKDAFYESPTLTAVRDNTYDLLMVRYVLEPGDAADLPTNNGAGMVMAGTGEVQVDHGGKLSLLGLEGNLGQGQMLRQPTSISNTSGAPTVVYYLYLGDTVGSASAAPAQNRSNNSSSSTSSSNSNSSSSTSATSTPDANGDGDQTQENTDTTTSPGQEPVDGVYRAQINIYAQSEIYLTVTVDGTVWFDGTLPEGRWTGPMIGSNFEVYTTSGENTMFEDACGKQFWMGYESGEAWYTLTASATSCPPPSD